MKKYIILFLTGVLIFSVISCTTQGDAGITGADGADTASIFFQNGVAPSGGYTGCEDTQILATSTNANYGSCDYILAGGFMGSPYHALIKFDISHIAPQDVNVISAEITLYFDDAGDLESPNTFTAYAVTKDWTEGTSDCSGSPDVNSSWLYYDGTVNSWDTQGGDYEAAAASDSVYLSSVSDGSSITFSLNADTVESWIKNPDTNYGLLIKGDTSSGTAWMRPCSSEYLTDINYRPRLKIDYTLP